MVAPVSLIATMAAALIADRAIATTWTEGAGKAGFDSFSFVNIWRL